MHKFITLEEVKTHLGIDDNTYDPQLQAILKTTLSTIQNKIGNISFGVKEEVLKKDTISARNCTLLICGYNPTKLLEIDGNPVNEGEYMIMDNGTIQVKNLQSYIKSPFSHFKVKYEGGLKENNALLGIVSELVAIEFSKEEGKEIASERTGPRSVSYVTSQVAGQNGMYKRDKLLASLNSFIPSHLKAYAI